MKNIFVPLFIKGRVHVLCYSSSFSIQQRPTTKKTIKMGEKSAPNIINDTERAFLPFKLIWPPYTTSYHFSSYLAYFPSIVAALRYSSSFSVQQRSVTQNMKMGKNVRPELLITLGAPYFQVLCDGLLLYLRAATMLGKY